MRTDSDVIVVGLGGMGSAAAAHLARRGRRVIGLERFGSAHAYGSSHGDSRVYRQAYFEDPDYVPLLLRAFELWQDLNATTGRDLLKVTGGLMIGPPDSRTVTGSRASAERWDLPHQMLDAAELHTRFPSFHPRPDEIALWETNAGFARPEATVAAHLDQAGRADADLRFGQAVTGWSAADGGVTVTTADETFRAQRLVLAAGAWASGVITDLGVPLRVERQVQFWFRPPGGTRPFAADQFPIYVWDGDDGLQIYGFPHDGTDAGVKAAFFRRGTPAEPETLRRGVAPDEVIPLLDFLRPRIPALPGPVVRAVPCMYTNTPDEHFVIGLHPSHPNVAVAAGFSGHGFKFVPVIGEILADLIIDGRSRLDISLFDPARLAAVPVPGPAPAHR
ncbi:MAG: N-methyl-L-tryptophan oxidase [Actinomycetota bacterium]|nr:N-methyl-L-tryptophan oxidase [Actinomycetota bacterium]